MRLVIVAVFMFASRAAQAGFGGLIIPPLEVDVGATAPLTGGDALRGANTDLLIGLSWASLSWKPTWFDIGAGYIGSFRDIPAGVTISDNTLRMTGSSGAWGETNTFSMNGGYLSLARTLVGREHARAWVALRGELLDAQLGDHSFGALGGAVRVASEIFVSGLGGFGDHGVGGALVGSFALGGYLEVSHREIPDALGPTGITIGVTLRIPFMAVVAH